MIELVVFIIVLNIIFEFLQIACPLKKLSSLVKSFFSVIIIYLICLKIKNYF